MTMLQVCDAGSRWRAASTVKWRPKLHRNLPSGSATFFKVGGFCVPVMRTLVGIWFPVST